MYKNVFLQTHLKTTFKSLQSTHESQIKAQPRNIMQEGTASLVSRNYGHKKHEHM